MSIKTITKRNMTGSEGSDACRLGRAAGAEVQAGQPKRHVMTQDSTIL
jgi:hypothetical protein